MKKALRAKLTIALLAFAFATMLLTSNAFAITSVTNFPTTDAIVSSGGFSSPNNAFADNEVYASAMNGQAEAYKTFGFTIPAGATINGITVNTEGHIGTCAKNTKKFSFTLSKNDGTSFTGSSQDLILTNADVLTHLSFSVSGWTNTDVNSIAVKADATCSGGNGAPGTLLLDFVSITIEYTPNTPPVANDDSYSTDENVALHVSVSNGVLHNDVDADGNTLTAILDTTTSHGTLSLSSNGAFTYTPNTDFFGTDTFTYHANDGFANSNTATVAITVNQVVQTLKVTKIVINDNGGALQVADFHLFIDGQPVTSGQQVSVTVGRHTVSETPTTGYIGTIGGNCNQDGIVSVQAGQNKACTITNNDVQGQTTIVKIIIPSGTGQVFSFTGDLGDFTLSDNNPSTTLSLDAGTYHVTEIVPNGWSLTSIVCNDTTNDSSGDLNTHTISIVVEVGDVITCTVTDKRVGLQGGDIHVDISSSILLGVQDIDPNTLPAPPSGIAVQQHLVGFQIQTNNAGDTVTVGVTFPNPVPAGSQFWKFQNAHWFQVDPAQIGSNDGDNFITVTITDGGLGDSDGMANGMIDDPLAPIIVSPPTHIGSESCENKIAFVNSDTVKNAPSNVDYSRGCVRIDDAPPTIVKVYIINNFFCADVTDNIGVAEVIATDKQLTVKMPRWEGSVDSYCAEFTRSEITGLEQEQVTVVAIDLAGNTAKVSTEAPALHLFPTAMPLPKGLASPASSIGTMQYKTHTSIAEVSRELNPHKDLEGIWLLNTGLKQIRITGSADFGKELQISDNAFQKLTGDTLIKIKWLGAHSNEQNCYTWCSAERHGFIYVFGANNGLLATFKVTVTDDMKLEKYDPATDQYHFKLQKIGKPANALLPQEISKILEIASHNKKHEYNLSTIKVKSLE